MGFEAEDYPRKQKFHSSNSNSNSNRNNNLYMKLKTILLVIFTNLATIFIFTNHHHDSISHHLLQELNSTKSQLYATHSLIDALHHKIESSNLLVQSLLIELTRESEPSLRFVDKEADVFDDPSTLSDELKLAILPHKLPLRSGEIYPPIGAACLRFQDELSRYMTYDIGGECPVDDVFAQDLMLKGCEPLPRRRCHPKPPVGYVEPDLKRGREKTRWLYDRGLNYGVDQVLRTKPAGTIRIGLDINGETGTFAARMRERNITIITSTMSHDGPFNNFIASRGLIPLHVSIYQRLPFFENTLDMVHWMNVLCNLVPDAMLELSLYDIYRVLRPGGLFWLDHFSYSGTQLNQAYAPMLDRIGFKKLRWDIGKKAHGGVDENELYFSALLEKPMT